MSDSARQKAATSKKTTRLEIFIQRHGLRPGDIAEWACISPQQLYRIRMGKAPGFRLDTARHILTACSHLLGRRVMMAEVFGRIGEE